MRSSKQCQIPNAKNVIDLLRFFLSVGDMKTSKIKKKSNGKGRPVRWSFFFWEDDERIFWNFMEKNEFM